MIDDTANQDNQEAGAGGGAPGGEPAGGEPPDELIGAYLLDALPDEERAGFEAHLRTSEAARREVAQLRPVVDLLPLALDGSLDEPASAGVAPSPDLRNRILAAARAEGADAALASEPVPVPPPVRRRAPAPTEPVPSQRPARERTAGSLAGTARSWIDRIGWPWLAAAVFALIAVGALIWALTLQDRLDEREDELAGVVQTATAEAGPGVQALAYIMKPTAEGPEGAGGVLFPQPEGSGTANLNVLGMPALPEGQVYQLWFVELDPQGNPDVTRPSVTFGVDDQGNGAAEVPLPAEPFDIVAVTQEPAGGSQTPSPPILMTGAPGTAAG